ncbi:unnamed protein product [Didymodactylos carnosus]|uniref:BTB domain-containing protein n=2 Tax=Didymodactylos carnosus TaxID=1234261 RepID=A0A815FIK5_9BILA|nr:unnamed protein product [Didymodactylos carnosus]CAF4172021.1 unnamed protein product [Didymodactylos carnosus]
MIPGKTKCHSSNRNCSPYSGSSSSPTIHGFTFPKVCLSATLPSSTSFTDSTNTTRHSIVCQEYQAQLFQTINHFRLNEAFTDVNIYVDGVVFPSHRLILSAASPYFHAMFSYNFRESKEGNVRIQDITPWTMKRILDFIYNGRTDINQDNLFEMLNASIMLSIKELTDLLIKFLYLQININNCIQIEQLATLYSLDTLRRTTLMYIVNHFMLLYEQNLFVYLNEHTLMEILSDDNLDIPKEEYVFDTIIKWVNFDFNEREQYFQSLFKFIRLNSISDIDYVTKYMRNEKLIETHPTCLKILKDFYSNNFTADLLGPIRPSTQIRYHLLLIELLDENICDGEDEKEQETKTDNEFTLTNNGDTCCSSCHSIVTDSAASFYHKFAEELRLDEHSKYDTTTSQNDKCESFDQRYTTNQIDLTPSITYGETKHRRQCCYLYAYDFFRTRWRSLGYLPEAFSSLSCVSTDSIFYLFGGQLSSGEISDRIWLFSYSTLKWQLSPVKMVQPRSHHKCILFHNSVLLFFGQTKVSGEIQSCKTVDMFDLSTEVWTCLCQTLPTYQCEPIVATKDWLLLSNRNDTQMLHTYKLRDDKQQRSHISEDLSSQLQEQDHDRLSSVSSLENDNTSTELIQSAKATGYYMLPKNVGNYYLVTDQDDLYLVYYQSKQIYRFNLVRNEILPKQPMLYSCTNGNCVLVGRKLIITGMVSMSSSNITDAEKEVLSTTIKNDQKWLIQIYALDEDRWYLLNEPLPTYRKHLLLMGKLS